MNDFKSALLDAELVEDESGIEIMDSDQFEMTALVVQQNEILTAIRDDLHIIMFFVLFSFCWSGIRAWRKNFAKGV